MGLHILVIGSRPDTQEPSDHLMDVVAAKLESREGFQVVRCEHPGELVERVKVARGRELVDVLDIFDHGGPGFQRLGDSFLFSTTGDAEEPLKGEETAIALRDHLSDVAQVRLLGCSTASGPTNGVTAGGAAGRGLVYRLARALDGRRIAFGTIRSVGEAAFGPIGFHREIERDFLFSSAASIDMNPPDRTERKRHVDEIDPPRL